MADDKNDYPSLQRNKQQGSAKKLRKRFSSLLEDPDRPISEFSKVKSVEEMSSGKSLEMPKTPMSLGEAKKTSSFGSDQVESILEKTKNALKRDSKPGGLEIKVPKITRTVSDIEVSDEIKSYSQSDSSEDAERASIYTADQLAAGADLSRDKENQLSLRYRIPKKLANLPKKDLKKLSDWITRQFEEIETERSEYMQRLLSYRNLWLDFVSTGMLPSFEGAHNVHVPMAFEKIKAIHARIYQAVMGIQPPFSLKPRNAVSEIQQEEKEQVLSFIIQDYANGGAGWEEVVDKDIWSFVADGTSITKHSWLRDVRKFTDVEEIFKGFKEGKEVYADKEIEKEEVIYDGPVLKQVPIEDFYITGYDVESVDSADLIGEASDWTKSELIKMTKLGFFFEDAVREVIKNEPSLPSADRLTDRSYMKSELEDLAGLNKETAGLRRYRVIEACCRYDIDGDEIDEDLVVWVERSTGRILRITYVERATPGGFRPYSIKKFINRPGSPYGIGLAECLFGLNNEIDEIHSQRLDYGTIQNLPFGFVRASSGSNKPKPIRLAPGNLYPVDDPQTDISFPKLNGGTAYGFQEEATVTRYADNISIPPIALGSQAAQGAARTATGAAALLNSVDVQLDIHIRRYQRGYKRNLMLLDKQITEMLPLGIAVRVLGADGSAILKTFQNRKPMRFNSDYELTGNSTNSNKAIERDTAQQLMQMLQNPIALQSGIVTPKNLYNTYKNMLQKFEVHNFKAYITSPEGEDASPYSAKDELSMILAGTEPPVYMQDRHQEKLAFFDAFENSEDFGWFTPEHVEIYRKVRREHENYAEAIAAQAGQAAQAGLQNPMAAATMAAGGGVPQGAPAQQMQDLIPGATQNQSGGNQGIS